MLSVQSKGRPNSISLSSRVLGLVVALACTAIGCGGSSSSPSSKVPDTSVGSAAKARADRSAQNKREEDFARAQHDQKVSARNQTMNDYATQYSNIETPANNPYRDTGSENNKAMLLGLGVIFAPLLPKLADIAKERLPQLADKLPLPKKDGDKKKEEQEKAALQNADKKPEGDSSATAKPDGEKKADTSTFLTQSPETAATEAADQINSVTSNTASNQAAEVSAKPDSVTTAAGAKLSEVAKENCSNVPANEAEIDEFVKKLEESISSEKT